MVLDAGGVLLLPSPEGLRDAVGPFGAAPDDETCRAAHYASTRAVDRLGEADWRQVDRMVAAELGVAEKDLDRAGDAVGAAYVDGPWVPVAGAAEALLDLQSAGFALAIVSNAGGTMEQILAGHRICSTTGGDDADVAVVVDSAVVGVEKPDPAIFVFALDALETPAGRCLYVGDTVLFDVDGARAAGLHPVHVDPYGACPLPDHPHIVSLQELVALLTGRG